MQSFVLFEATIEAYRQEWRDKQRLKEEDRADRDENTFRKLKNRLKEHEQ
jgi:seryl-tRNA(Sec) selenium transferase